MKGILIADAGSTKSDWSLINDRIIRFRTPGINPLQMSPEEIITILFSVREEFKGLPIHQIKFFGAGCIKSVELKMKQLLSTTFPKAKNIETGSDILAAAKALFGKSDGIACILGTGSNTCLFEKGNIIAQIPSLGYVLGDEGGGVSLGKRLINGIFKLQFTPDITKKFEDKYHISVEDLIENVYKQPMPSAYLANFSSFLLENIHEPQIINLINQEFDNFFVKNIFPYKEFSPEMNTLGFIGGIAFSLREFIYKIAEKYEYKISDIIPKPMPALEKFYLENPL